MHNTTTNSPLIAAKKFLNKFRAYAYVKVAYKVSKQPSYYPEFPRKSALRRFWEILRYNLRTGDTGGFYNIYGLDVVGLGRSEKDFMPYFGGLSVMRDAANHLGAASSQVAVLRDKYLFFRFMETFGLPTPRVVGVVDHKGLCSPSMARMQPNELPPRPLFLKDIDGECASYVKKLNSAEDIVREIPKLSNGCYILQEALYQHSEVANINPGCINTIRLATVRTHDRIEVFGAVMRFGTSETGCVDNSAAGGICVGVDCDHGTLMKFGFYKPKYGIKTESHPDSHLKFEGFVIPYFHEAVRLAKEAHRQLPRIHSIGWDIAITPEGPVFIEGNDNWEIKSMQASYGGLKQRWYDYFPDDVAIPRRLRRRQDGTLP